MPANGFSVGRDVSLSNFTTGGLIGTGSLKEFAPKQITAEVKQVLITGIPLFAYLPEGWQGSATFARFDSTLDDFFCAAEANYYSGASLPGGQITETITNPDGTISTYLYTNLALKYEGAGTWSGNREVDQQIAWMASRRLKL